MKLNKFLGILFLSLSVIIIILVVIWHGLKENNIMSTVIPKDNQKDYNSIVIHDYPTYFTTINKYQGEIKLKPEDFRDYDYILNFIPYQNNLKIKKSHVIVGEEITVIYKLNKPITDANEYVINLVKINKGIIKKELEINILYE